MREPRLFRYRGKFAVRFFDAEDGQWRRHSLGTPNSYLKRGWRRGRALRIRRRRVTTAAYPPLDATHRARDRRPGPGPGDRPRRRIRRTPPPPPTPNGARVQTDYRVIYLRSPSAQNPFYAQFLRRSRIWARTSTSVLGGGAFPLPTQN